MPQYRLDTLIELEKNLCFLRSHYVLGQNLEAPDLLSRAQSFLSWSLVSVEYCGPWSKENLARAANLSSDMGRTGYLSVFYRALEEAMTNAAQNIQEEIYRCTMVWNGAASA